MERILHHERQINPVYQISAGLHVLFRDHRHPDTPSVRQILRQIQYLFCRKLLLSLCGTFPLRYLCPPDHTAAAQDVPDGSKR